MKSLLESATVESTALYFNLSVGVAQHWESYGVIENPSEYTQDANQSHVAVVRSLSRSKSKQSLDLNKGLRVSVRGLINQIFDQFEKDYGVLFTRFAVGLITFSRTGK
jgi:hypothetical protein